MKYFFRNELLNTKAISGMFEEVIYSEMCDSKAPGQMYFVTVLRKTYIVYPTKFTN